MAAFPLPSGALISLPNELLLEIAGYLDEPDLRALSLVNRRLSSSANYALYGALYANPKRCKEVLLWTVEVGRHELLRELLGRGVNPCFLYASSLLRSRLMDVFSAQGGRRGTAAPRDDGILRAEIFREKYCRNGTTRRMAQRLHEKHHREASIAQDLDYHAAFREIYPNRHPGPFPRFSIVHDPAEAVAPWACNYWSWAPIHVAVLRGDKEAVRLLLDHGADVNAQCSGLCDCAVPPLDGQDYSNESLSPHHFRSVWTPLHVAICSGNKDTARLLIARRASYDVGCFVHRPRSLSYPSHPTRSLSMTAMQSAAWLGSVPMCSLILENPGFGWAHGWGVDGHDRRGYRPLHYAAAGGHIRTVGKFLLEKGAAFPYYEDGTRARRWRDDSYILVNDPLRLLCMQRRYDDARWLVRFCENLYGDSIPVRELYTRALAVLCSLREPAVYSSLNLRQQQAGLCEFTTRGTVQRDRADRTPGNSRKTEKDRKDREDRLSLAEFLLGLGANPNMPEPTCARDVMPVLITPGRQPPIRRTSLQMAAHSGFADMVKLLVRFGADCNLVGGGRQDDLAELPVMLAASIPARHSKWSADRLDPMTAQALVDHGASMDVVGRLLLLHFFHGMKATFTNDSIPSDIKQPTVWLDFMGAILRTGVASEILKEDWKKIVVDACRSGLLPLCEKLWAARPISPLSRAFWIKMLANAVAARSEPLFPWTNGQQDEPRLISWVLGHCINEYKHGHELISVSELDNLCASVEEREVGLITYTISRYLDTKARRGRV